MVRASDGVRAVDPTLVGGTVAIADKIKRNGLLAPGIGARTRHAGWKFLVLG